MKDNVLVELRDDQHRLLGEISRVIQQKGSAASLRKIEYRGKQYVMYGGIRTPYWITIYEEKES